MGGGGGGGREGEDEGVSNAIRDALSGVVVQPPPSPSSRSYHVETPEPRELQFSSVRQEEMLLPSAHRGG